MHQRTLDSCRSQNFHHKHLAPPSSDQMFGTLPTMMLRCPDYILACCFRMQAIHFNTFLLIRKSNTEPTQPIAHQPRTIYRQDPNVLVPRTLQGFSAPPFPDSFPSSVTNPNPSAFLGTLIAKGWVYLKLQLPTITNVL